jgi:hypothetical protein
MKDSPPPIDPPEANNAAGAGCMTRIVRQFSQVGYALVENRTAALPITLGFEITVWEAERSLKELRSKVGAEFYQEIHIVRATLKFSLPNA